MNTLDRTDGETDGKKQQPIQYNRPKRFFKQTEGEQDRNNRQAYRATATSNNPNLRNNSPYVPKKKFNRFEDRLEKMVSPEMFQRLIAYEQARQERARARIAADPAAKLATKSKYGLNVKNKLKYDWKKIAAKFEREDELKRLNGGVLPPRPAPKPKPVLVQESKESVGGEGEEPHVEEVKIKPPKPRVYKKTGLPLPPPKPKKLWVRGTPCKLEGIIVPDGEKPQIKGITAEEKGLKNPIFIKNVVDPLTEKIVEEIWCYKVMKPTQFTEFRDKWDLVWQYFRDRHKHSIEETYKKFEHDLIKLKYMNDDGVYFIDHRIPKEKERWLKFVNDPTYTEQRHGEKSLPENWGKPKLPPLNPPPKKGEVKRVKMLKRILAKGRFEFTNEVLVAEVKVIVTKVPLTDFDVDLAIQKKQIEEEDRDWLKQVINTIKPEPKSEETGSSDHADGEDSSSEDEVAEEAEEVDEEADDVSENELSDEPKDGTV
jgi:hypothetical protein